MKVQSKIILVKKNTFFKILFNLSFYMWPEFSSFRGRQEEGEERRQEAKIAQCENKCNQDTQ